MTIEAVLSNEASWHVEVCHVLDGLRALPDRSIHVAVTSPPYWGLRDYDLPPSIWGGDPACEHEWGAWQERHDVREETISGKTRTTDRYYGDSTRRFDGNHQKHTAGSFCTKCDAWRGCFGLEPRPGMFVDHAVEIFRELRRALRDDGTLWLNLGDSYSQDAKWGGGLTGTDKNAHSKAGGYRTARNGRLDSGLKQGDLCNVPHQVATALQADGWYWRSTIVWAKRSPMPESLFGWRWERHKVKVADSSRGGEEYRNGSATTRKPKNDHEGKDFSRREVIDCPGCDKCRATDGHVLRKGSWRPTNSHEYIFQFAKSPDYFCDGEAVREACVSDGGSSFGKVDREEAAHEAGAQARNIERGDRERYIEQGRNARGVWTTKTTPNDVLAWLADRGVDAELLTELSDESAHVSPSVWTLSSEPYKAAHFATFPTELPRKCILAGTSARGYCAKCGEPWAPVIDSQLAFASGSGKSGRDPVGKNGAAMQGGGDTGDIRKGPIRSSAVVGWRATCDCNCPETTSAVVLDPFNGAGTTGLVAVQIGQRYIGLEQNAEYAAQSRTRIAGRSGVPGIKPLAGQKALF